MLKLYNLAKKSHEKEFDLSYFYPLLYRNNNCNYLKNTQDSGIGKYIQTHSFVFNDALV